MGERRSHQHRRRTLRLGLIVAVAASCTSTSSEAPPVTVTLDWTATPPVDVSDSCAEALNPLRELTAHPPTSERVQRLVDDPEIVDEAYDTCTLGELEAFLTGELYPWLDASGEHEPGELDDAP